ncbi:AMP-binding protein [Neoaquamicrobium microcysteis]|uniref:AMP-binding protein n=1 Tax=Neoaquamicrobium microcysteis TaxID=2682781 RepID=UPI0013758422|nr:AMP-binding protein [Mesorhizobium microcysteis]
MKGLRDFTVWSVIARNSAVRREAAAFRHGEAITTHGDHKARCEALATWLAGFGVLPGDRIAVLAENHIGFHTLLGAAARLGAIVVPLNWRLSEAELAGIVADCEPAVLIADDATMAVASTIAGVAPLKLAATMGEPAGAFVGFEAAATSPGGVLPPPPEADAVLLLVYTAAVDGVARGAMITHGNMIAAAAQLCLATGLAPADVFLGNLPAFHIMGLGFSFAVQFAGGATVVRPRFDAADAAAVIAAEGVTTIGSFPPMLAAILDAAQAGGHDLSSLKTCLGLEAPSVVERLETEWPRARFWTGFGQTETTGIVTIGMARDRPGSSGTQGPLCEIAIVDEADRPAAQGTVGEIVVRGPIVMSGYWRRDEENAVVFRNGWHHTGDLGKLVGDGALHYAGRTPAKELIKTGGENVYPAEVEHALLQHPSVTEAVVFGVPDPQWGEVVVALVVAHGPTPEVEELAEFAGNRIARYKRPRKIIFADALPRDQNGRVDRSAAKARHGRASIQ